jgi:hypothetical protein
MEIKNAYYKEHLKELCKEVPTDVLSRIVGELSINAKFYMNGDTSPEDLVKINDAIVDLLKTRFSWLPLHLVGEAYVKGSLGELGGTTKLSARNVYTWLSNVDEKARTLRTQEISRVDESKRTAEERVYLSNQANNVLYGTALSLKLSWFYPSSRGRFGQGIYLKGLDPSLWDRYPLDKIVEKLKQGYTVQTLTPTKL